jgi:ribosomal protein S18 acetylase RimI-like enzyme
MRDPAGALYLLSDLDEPHFSHCRWFVARPDGAPNAVYLLYSGLPVPSLNGFGEPEEAARLLDSRSDWPRGCWLKAPPSHWPALEQVYRTSDVEPIVVMTLPPEVPCLGSATPARRWRESEPADPLLRLYEHYPGNFFALSTLSSNLYYVVEQDGRLVAAAGTHTWSAREGVAAIGNVVTASEHRGRGLAGACVAALCADLRARGVTTIGLHVAASNRSAIRAYEKLGFIIACRLVQAWGDRKDVPA